MPKLMYIMFTYGDNYVGNKQVATVRILYTVAFYFGKKCTWSNMTSVVPMWVDFYPY